MSLCQSRADPRGGVERNESISCGIRYHPPSVGEMRKKLCSLIIGQNSGMSEKHEIEELLCLARRPSQRSHPELSLVVSGSLSIRMGSTAFKNWVKVYRSAMPLSLQDIAPGFSRVGLDGCHYWIVNVPSGGMVPGSRMLTSQNPCICLRFTRVYTSSSDRLDNGRLGAG